jgi:hypothetical protein
MKNILVLCIAVLFLSGIALATDANISYDNVKTPSATTPNVPDPNIILQGGDTVNDATVVSALPYSDNGTTAGYTNDYDEVCPYANSTSPDVVYSYAPANDLTVDITLCTNSQYDTKLYVYENTVGNLVACNDDLCPGYVSELSGVDLTGGNTYYIVIDGYSGAFGAYTIDIEEVEPPPPPPNCDESLFGQVVMQPSESWTAATSDAGSPGPYLVYDNFNSGGLIGAVKFWGLDLRYNSGWFDCVEDPMTFEINFYENNNGQPGTMMESFMATSPAVPANLSYAGFPLNEYYCIIDQPFIMDNGWFSIQGVSDPTNCWFLWMSGNGIDGAAFQWDGQNLNPTAYDLSICLYTQTTSIDGSTELVPAEYDVLSAYPNPFNAKTTIAFSLKESGNVQIAIHDLLGRQVDVIELGHLGNSTVHSVNYDAGNLATGVYYYSLMVDGARKSTQKFSLLK